MELRRCGERHEGSRATFTAIWIRILEVYNNNRIHHASYFLILDVDTKTCS